MRLEKLSVRDFRGFSQLKVDFAPDVTVLVGINGAGKTSLLDAIALGLTCVARSVQTGRAQAIALSTDNVRVGARAAEITVEAEIEGTACTWTASTPPPGQLAEAGPDLEVLQVPLAAVQDSIAAGAPRLPLGVYFPTNRSAHDIATSIRTPRTCRMLDAYDGALEGGMATFRGFFEWFREEEDVFHEQMMLARDDELPLAERSRLPHVRRAIEEFFPGARELRIERRYQRMTLLHNGSRLDVVHLSDGEKCLLAMVGDLARRMALAAPTSENPLAHPAVVLIDELELHLHPGLQRTILQRLKKVFPNAQFVVSSHSPQVLSSVQTTNVRVLDRFEIRPLERESRRRDPGASGGRQRSMTPLPGPTEDIAAKLRELSEVLDEKC